MTHVTIIGGGIAGLATAFYLQQKSRQQGQAINYTLLESGSRFGGKITTEVVDDFIIEGGPDSFLTQKPWGLQLCRDLGLTDRLIPTNDDRRNIFVLNKGKLTPFPGGYRLTVPTEFIPFALSPLISPWGKLRMGLDLFIPPRHDAGDESLADFIRRRLGTEALDKIAGPMMAGIYVANPERLSINSTFPMFVDMEKKYGSLIKAMQAAKKRSVLTGSQQPSTGNGQQSAVSGQMNGQLKAMFTSLAGGMQELVDTLVGRLTGDLRLNCPVTWLRYLSPGFEINFDSPQVAPLRTDAVVLAVPAYTTAGLIELFAPELAALLRGIRYVSTATVSLGYRQADLAGQSLDGFGFMVPKSEKRQILACTWSSTKFNYRAPATAALIRLFVGGDEHEGLVDLPGADLLALARAEVSAIMGLKAIPVVQRIFRWPQGNPQYDVGHLERVIRMEQLAAQIPGLHLTGSAFRGIGIPDCVKSALATVESLLNLSVNQL